MGVIYIGDRFTGKTSLALELANPKSKYVKVIDPLYENLKALLDGEEGKGTDAHQSTYDRQIEIEVILRGAKTKKIYTEWIDTPGEIWRAKWQQDNHSEWIKFVETARASEGVILIVPPYREIVRPDAEPEKFVTEQQWIRRFDRWVEFFQDECPNTKHIALCLNKADLLQGVDLKQEAQQLAYHPQTPRLNWNERHNRISKQFFRPVRSHIARLNQCNTGLAVKCFITSIHNRALLELPWIYLGTFLQSD